MLIVLFFIRKYFKYKRESPTTKKREDKYGFLDFKPLLNT